MPRAVEDSTVVLVDPVAHMNVLARSIDAGNPVKADHKRKTLIVDLREIPKDEKPALSFRAVSTFASAARYSSSNEWHDHLEVPCKITDFCPRNWLSKPANYRRKCASGATTLRGLRTKSHIGAVTSARAVH